ncbi:MAG: riboflavin synthase [Rickettsiales bacterium]|jgi:riboflavin synthase|nr:riboflavin synthase [Rickettsiales bacterium]
MFTGIITDIGKINAIKHVGGSDIEIILELTSTKNIVLGESIATNGVCLTVTEIDGRNLKFYLSKETIDCSNFADVKEGDHVNIEKSLKLSDGLSGHMVSGHVDFIADILDIVPINNSFQFNISLETKHRAFFIDKGSVAINGISLTVNKVLENAILINIIPHTLENTALAKAKIGDKVNIEIDMVAKYIVGAGDVYKK